MTRAAQIRIGISGWTYAPWRGVFYPEDLPHKRELEYAGRCFKSIEINGSFYSLQRPSSYRKWYEQTPGDFVFAIKGGRFITHMRRLRDVQTPLANFFASGVLLLKEKLGPILWQFPPNMKYDYDLFEHFFELLPRDTQSAAAMARRHDRALKHGAWTRSDRKQPLHYAVEVRNVTFNEASFIRLLRKHRIAWCFADSAGKWPYTEDLTADFAYVRLHGAEELYASGYSDSALEWWAQRIRTWAAGREPTDAHHLLNQPPKPRKFRDVFVYFDNDIKVKAPFDAMALARKLSLNRN